MDFSSFDTEKIDRYAAEAKEKWGKTEAYKEFETKTAGQSKAQMRSTGDKLMDIFKEFGAIRHRSPACEEAQALVAKLQSFITDNYYTCTKQILFGLGQMYAGILRLRCLGRLCCLGCTASLAALSLHR